MMRASEALFSEIDRHICTDAAPSEYLRNLGGEGFADTMPFTMLERLKSTPQSPQYHPEGSAWNHTLLVVDEAAARKEDSGDPRVFLWAALLHDIGKPDTTKRQKGRYTAYDHDRVGAKLTAEFLTPFPVGEEFIRGVSALVRWHMQILYVEKGLPFVDLGRMRKEADPADVALLGLCDRLGRLGADTKAEEKAVSSFLIKCKEE